VEASQLEVVNRGSVPTFQTIGGKSVIDVTLINGRGARLLNVSGWEVDITESFSDHRYVKFQIGGNLPEVEWKRRFRSADWNVFSQVVEDSLESRQVGPAAEAILDTQEGDRILEQLYDSIEVGLNTTCPRRPVQPNTKGKKWWTGELARMREELRAVGDKRRFSDFHHQRFIALRLQYKYAIKNAKQQAWRQFCSEAQTAKDVGHIVKILDQGSGSRGTLSLLREGESYARTPEESVRILVDTHFPGHITAHVVERESQGEAETDYRYGPLYDFLTLDRVKEAINSFGAYKAAGPDGLPPIVLQKLGPCAMTQILSVYRTSIARSWIPASWRNMNLVFIPKPGKDDYSSAKAYRPITLSNFLLKGLERIVHWHISDKISNRQLVSQHAYLRGRSTESALSEALDGIESAVLQGQQALVVSLDCTGAFDRIQFDSATQALADFGIEAEIQNWYNKLLVGRIIKANPNGSSYSFSATRGSPQGGILSPLIWNLIMDSLLRQFQVRQSKQWDMLTIFC
jgi:hypothetical protein